MKMLVFIFFAHFVLGHGMLDAASMINNEVEVSDARIETEDLWCWSDKDCAVGNECKDKKCIPLGAAQLADLKNCVEIEVYGFDSMDKSAILDRYTKESRKRGLPLRIMDGEYSIIDRNGRKAFKKEGTHLYTSAGSVRSMDVYIEFNIVKKQWEFQSRTNYVMARSVEQVADDTESVKRFSFLRRDGWIKNRPVSFTCKEYSDSSEDSEESYWVEDGCKADDQDDFLGRFRPSTEEHGVRCCSNEGSCTTTNHCYGTQLTYQQAEEYCAKEDRRLCTKEEMQKNICCGTGGMCDMASVWTSTRKEVTEEEQLATENQRLREQHKALKQALRAMGV